MSSKAIDPGLVNTLVAADQAAEPAAAIAQRYQAYVAKHYGANHFTGLDAKFFAEANVTAAINDLGEPKGGVLHQTLGALSSWFDLGCPEVIVESGASLSTMSGADNQLVELFKLKDLPTGILADPFRNLGADGHEYQTEPDNLGDKHFIRHALNGREIPTAYDQPRTLPQYFAKHLSLLFAQPADQLLGGTAVSQSLVDRVTDLRHAIQPDYMVDLGVNTLNVRPGGYEMKDLEGLPLGAADSRVTALVSHELGQEQELFEIGWINQPGFTDLIWRACKGEVLQPKERDVLKGTPLLVTRFQDDVQTFSANQIENLTKDKIFLDDGKLNRDGLVAALQTLYRLGTIEAMDADLSTDLDHWQLHPTARAAVQDLVGQHNLNYSGSGIYHYNVSLWFRDEDKEVVLFAHSPVEERTGNFPPPKVEELSPTVEVLDMGFARAMSRMRVPSDNTYLYQQTAAKLGFLHTTNEKGNGVFELVFANAQKQTATVTFKDGAWVDFQP